jgi:hypothetical protein
MSVREATRIIFQRYVDILSKKSEFGAYVPVPEVSYSFMALSNIDVWPIDKLSRWLGYVQGILVYHKIIRVNDERDFSRPLFHEAYERDGIEIPPTQDATPIDLSVRK